MLQAAQRAAREGSSLSAADISAIRQPILNPPTPEELAEERRREQEVSWQIQSAPCPVRAAQHHVLHGATRSTCVLLIVFADAWQAQRAAQDKEQAERAARAEAAAAEAKAQKEAQEKVRLP